MSNRYIGVIVDGPREGRQVQVPEPPPERLNFPFAHDTPPVAIGGTIPDPLPVPEAYELESPNRDELGRYHYRYVAVELPSNSGDRYPISPQRDG